MRSHPIFFLLFITISLKNVKCLQQKMEMLNVTADYNTVNTFTLNSSTFYAIHFGITHEDNPFRIRTWTKESSLSDRKPILIVARQETQISSWQLPYVLETTTHSDIIKFDSVAHTMCPDEMGQITSDLWSGPLIISQSFMVTMSTINTQNIEVNISATEEVDFYVKNDITYNVTISPSESRFYYYAFNENSSDTVFIEIDSEDDICLTVSIQQSTCPVLDTNKDVTYEGHYQTINRKGAITIQKNNFKKGFFVTFVAKADNYLCSEENSALSSVLSRKMKTNMLTSLLTFKITNSINNYLIATLVIGTLVVFLIFCILALITVAVFHKWGTLSNYKKSLIENDGENHYQVDQSGPLTEPQIDALLRSDLLTVQNLAHYPKKDKKRSFHYFYHILSIAIFYSIPVVQLVVTYQRVLNKTGNQDTCYYNFLCAHPLGGFSDFNHIYSNIGYVITGILFIVITLSRQSKIKIRLELGIPVHYGLFYAMGLALIIEGVLSACYHICPTQSNYQFDTSFMYIMAVLCMVKLYQNRHPDINATAYATFTVLGVAIFLAMIGILNGSLAIWIIFTLMYSILCIYLSFKVYFFGYVIEGIKQFKSEVDEDGFALETLAPIRKARFILLLIINLANYSILIAGLALYGTHATDFGTFLLALLMGNAIIHSTFYVTMKIIHKERICFEAIIFGVLALASWAAASVFFFDAATLWTVTAAESRQWNQGCIVMDFYDKHDIWHLLSAPALFFTFMMLLYLDDDLVNKKQTEIPVF